MCWEKKTHLSKGLCGSEPYIAPELFDQKGSSEQYHKSNTKTASKSTSTSKTKTHHKSNLSKHKLDAIVEASASASSSSPTSSLDFPSPSPRSPAHVQAIARHKLTFNPEYDARQVDVWAAAIVFYCMQFQELPWRVAKNTDPTYNTYRSQYGIGTTESASATPPPLNNLIPRECRNMIKHMLDPDPKTRWSIDEALQDKWMKSITVCKEGEVNDHAHTTAGLDIVKI